MVWEINSVEVHPGRDAEFEAAFARAVPLLLQVRGCRSAELLRCLETPGHYQVRVDWTDLTDHSEHYPTTTEAAEIRALLIPLIAKAKPAHFEQT